MLSMLTAVGLLIGLGNRKWIASSHGNEDQLTLVCIVYVLVLVVKCASELLLTCGAYKVNARTTQQKRRSVVDLYCVFVCESS